MKKFNGFTKYGYLPSGVYNMTLTEVEELFCKNKSEKRKIIMAEYKNHLEDIKNTGYCLDHWIGGSYITSKENPDDIDTLTEFDGEKVEADGKRQIIDDLINNSKTNTNNCCHSLRIYKYPPNDERRYRIYIESKLRILIGLFGHDENDMAKGIIHLRY